MSPRDTKPEIKSYRPVLSVAARDSFSSLAAALGFTVTRAGTYEGLPSVSDLLESVAAAYRLDPAGTLDALRALLAPPNAPDA